MKYTVRITHKNPDDKIGTIIEHISHSDKMSQSEALIHAIVDATSSINDFENYNIVIEKRD